MRLMFAALGAVLLICSVASASASAEACTKKAGSKNFTLCVEGQKTESEKTEFSTKLSSPTAVLELPKSWKETGKPPMEWVCTQQSEGAVLNTLGGTTAQLVLHRLGFTECTTQNYKKCTLPSSSQMLETVGHFGSSPGQLFISPKSGNVLQQFFLNGAECPHAFGLGTKSVTGKYECKLLEAEVESVQHELHCESQGKFETGGETLIDNESPWTAHIRYSLLIKSVEGKKFSIYER